MKNPDNPNGCLIDEPPASEDVSETAGKVGICPYGTQVPEESDDDTLQCVAPWGEHLN
ncbi:MAG: hypothetical protein M3311_08160 [Thermoproteota archaeon]|nr:hypothetical protein [Thermoproteota archaeon]